VNQIARQTAVGFKLYEALAREAGANA